MTAREIVTVEMPAPDAPLEVRTRPEPELAPDSALMRVLHSEVCGTDVHLREGRLAGVPYPLIPGHVSVGHLERIRGTLFDVDGDRLEEGDLVTFLDVHGTCGACWSCLVAKATTRCPDRRVYGITFGADDGLAGGWAEKIYLRPGTRVLKLGTAAPRRFMAGGCGLPTAIHAIERAEVALGASVLVLGAGPVGLSAVALARCRGAAQVLVLAAPAARLQAASAMGADLCADFRTMDEAARLDWVREHTGGRGADVVIEASGAPDAAVTAMRAARDAGRVVIVGQYTDRGDASFNPHADLNAKHLDVRGCWGSDFSHFHRAVQVAGHATLGAAWDALPVRDYPLTEAAAALGAIETGDVVKALLSP